MKLHAVKSWPPFFEEILLSKRTHELRKSDRGYRTGDCLELREFDPSSGSFTGRTCMVQIRR